MKTKPTNFSQKAVIIFYYIAISSYTICLLFFLPDNINYSRWGILQIDLITSIFVYTSFVLLIKKKISLKAASFIYVYAALLNIIFSSWNYFITLTDYTDLLLICTSIYCINLAIGGFCINHKHAYIAAILYILAVSPIMILSKDPVLNHYWIIIDLLISTFAAGISVFLYLLEKAYQSELRLSEQIHLKEKALSEETEKVMKSELLFRQKEILTKTMFLAEYSENNIRFMNSLNGFKSTLKPKERSILDNILQSHRINHHEQYWKEFETSFLKINSEFKVKLLDSCPHLSPAEYKLAALIHLGLSSKQIASLSSNTIDSIEVARSRLRNKLKIPTDISLKSFLLNM